MAFIVRLQIYNIKGQLVRTIVNEEQSPGRYNVVWQGDDQNNRNVASGLYFYRFQTKAGVEVKKMVLMK